MGLSGASNQASTKRGLTSEWSWWWLLLCLLPLVKPVPSMLRSVLDEVRALWEAKLVATGVVGEPSIEGQQ